MLISFYKRYKINIKHFKRENKRIRLGYNKTIALTFLDIGVLEQMIQSFEIIIFRDCKNLQSFFNYYKQTLNDFKPGLFSIFKEIDRTNNASERHNRELKQSLQKHSRIITFLGI